MLQIGRLGKWRILGQPKTGIHREEQPGESEQQEMSEGHLTKHKTDMMSSYLEQVSGAIIFESISGFVASRSSTGYFSPSA